MKRQSRLIDPMQRVREYPLRRLGLATQHDLVGTDRAIATRTQQVTDDATRGHLGNIQDADFFAYDTSGGAVTHALSPAAAVQGQRVTIKKTDASANTVTVDPNGAETIDGGGSYAISAQWAAVTVQADAGAWFIVAEVV